MTLPLVIGLGSRHGDDRAGWMVVERLHQLGYPADHLRIARNPADILDWLEDAAELIICDAAEGNGAAGTVSRWRWPPLRLELLRSRGSHDLDVAELLTLAEQLGRGPASLEIRAIAGGAWIPETDASAEVRLAATQAAESIWKEYADAELVVKLEN